MGRSRSLIFIPGNNQRFLEKSRTINSDIVCYDLESYYGGRKRIGYNLDHHKDAGGAIIRNALQQLEASGYVEKKSKGRSISNEGMKRVDRLATEIFKDISKLNKDLERYA